MFIFGPLPDDSIDILASELDRDAANSLAGLYTLARAGHSVLSSIESIAAEHGLTPAQFRLLMVLRFRYREGAPMSDVAEALAIRAPSLTELVATGSELFTRTSDDSDRRHVILSASAEGHRRLDRTLPAMAAHAASLRAALGPTWENLIPTTELLFDHLQGEKA